MWSLKKSLNSFDKNSDRKYNNQHHLINTAMTFSLGQGHTEVSSTVDSLDKMPTPKLSIVKTIHQRTINKHFDTT